MKELCKTIERFFKVHILIIVIILSLATMILGILGEFFNKRDSSIVFKSIYIFFATLLTLVSLIVLAKKFYNDHTISNSEAKRQGKKLAGIIGSVNPTHIIIVDGNALNFYEKYVVKNISLAKPTLIRFSAEKRLKTANFYVTKYTPDYLIVTQQFYLRYNDGLLNNFKSTDKILVFDDVVRTGDTSSQIVDFIKRINNLSYYNFYLLCMIMDRSLRSSRIIDYAAKTGNLDDTYDYCWRSNDE